MEITFTIKGWEILGALRCTGKKKEAHLWVVLLTRESPRREFSVAIYNTLADSMSSERKTDDAMKARNDFLMRANLMAELTIAGFMYGEDQLLHSN